MIIERETDLGEHHILNLSPGSRNLRQHHIEQVKTLRVDFPDNPIPHTINATWYWVANIPDFRRVDSISCHWKTLYVLQMTIKVDHDPVDLSVIEDDLGILQDQGAMLVCITLVDVRTRQWAFQKRRRMLQDGTWWSSFLLILLAFFVV
jgi:hypothetical protein